MRKMLLSLAVLAGLFSSTGCVVYARPHPVAVYEVYDGPAVVYYHEEYRGGYYYHRHYWR